MKAARNYPLSGSAEGLVPWYENALFVLEARKHQLDELFLHDHGKLLGLDEDTAEEMRLLVLSVYAAATSVQDVLPTTTLDVDRPPLQTVRQRVIALLICATASLVSIHYAAAYGSGYGTGRGLWPTHPDCPNRPCICSPLLGINIDVRSENPPESWPFGFPEYGWIRHIRLFSHDIYGKRDEEWTPREWLASLQSLHLMYRTARGGQCDEWMRHDEQLLLDVEGEDWQPEAEFRDLYKSDALLDLSSFRKLGSRLARMEGDTCTLVVPSQVPSHGRESQKATPRSVSAQPATARVQDAQAKRGDFNVECAVRT